MKAEDTPFLSLLGGGQRQFVIPVFQRDYSWTEAQCGQLLADLIRVAKQPQGATHFFGSVVYVASGDQSAVTPKWLVIDGQQRLTTCTILLVALRNRLKEIEKQLEISDSPAALDEQFLTNKFAAAELRAKLALRGGDNDCLQALLSGTAYTEGSHSKVLANAEFFRTAIGDGTELLLLRGLRRLVVVSVSLKPGQDNPQLIFESLNSTGMALTQADLVRNYVLMGHPEQQQTEWYRKYWLPLERTFGVNYGSAFDNFLRDFLTLELNPPRPLKLDKVYREFRSWYPMVSNDNEDVVGDPAKLERLLRFGKHYCSFMFASAFEKSIDDGLRRIQKLVDVAAPVVMVLLERWNVDKSISDGDLVEALDLLESYVMRRSMSGAETRSGGQIFAALAQRIAIDKPLSRLKASLARQPKVGEFPDDATFTHALVTQDLYGRRNLKFLLDRLTNMGKEQIHVDNLTIEHVLPRKEILAPEWQEMLGSDWKTVRAQCLHKLGNLTLTGFNSELEAKPFLEKKNHPEWGYANSPVAISRSIAKLDQWGPVQIEDRAKALAQQALKVWKPLVADPAMIKQLELEEARERSANYSLDNIKWAPGIEDWFQSFRKAVLSIADDVAELPGAKTVVYRAPDWFLEVIPRAKGFAVRFAADANDLVDISPNVQDSSSWVFVTHSTVTGGSLFVVWSVEDATTAIALARKTYELMFS